MKKMLAIATTVLLGLSIAYAGTTVTVKGSDTLVRLGQRWAEEYMKKNPGSTIQVSGGGSGTGIAALLNGSTDICEASRDMKKKEYKLAERKGITPHRVAVALDGVAIFLNDKNPVNELSLAQLKGMFTGSITNWKEVGGKDATVILYGRENSSGTYAFLKEHVLKKEDYSERAQGLPGTAAVVNAVAKDVNGIGYGGIAWAKGVKYASVKTTEKSEAIAPSLETVSDGSYPISRELYWFFNGQPKGELKKLLDFALSADGQKVAASADYIPLPNTVAVK